MKLKSGIAALLALCFLAIGSVSFAGDLTEEFSAEVEVEKVNVNEADAETIAAALTGVGRPLVRDGGGEVCRCFTRKTGIRPRPTLRLGGPMTQSGVAAWR